MLFLSARSIVRTPLYLLKLLTILPDTTETPPPSAHLPITPFTGEQPLPLLKSCTNHFLINYLAISYILPDGLSCWALEGYLNLIIKTFTRFHPSGP